MAKQKSQSELSKKHIAHSERTQRQQRWIIIGISIVAALVVLVLGYGVIDQNYLQGQKAVARVGNEKVTAEDFRNQTQLARIERFQQFNYNQAILQYALQISDFDTYLQAYYNMQNIQSQMENAETFASSNLDGMVDDILLRQQAVKLSPPVTVSDSEVEESLQKLFNFYPSGTPTAQPTSTAWLTPTFSRTQIAILGPTKTPAPTATQDLTITPTGEPTLAPTSELPVTATPAITLGPAGTATPYTQEGYKTNLQDYLASLEKFNLTENDLREYWKTQLLRQKVFDAVTGDVSSEEEQVWARHILVASEEEANNVLARLKAGEDWSTLAAEVSIDTGTKTLGGDLDWFPRGVMVEPFEEAAFAMKVGETSSAVKTSMGYHIIQVLGHETRPLADKYLSRAKSKVYSDWISKLRSETEITLYDLWKEFIPTEPTVQMPSSE